MTTAAIVQIMDSVKTKIEAITPNVRPGVKFRHRLSKEALSAEVKDVGFERAYRVIPHTGVVAKTYGIAAVEMDGSFDIEIGYVGGEDDDSLQRQVASDLEQVIVALQSIGLTWPSCLANILPAGEPRVIPIGSGTNTIVVSWSWKITYDVT